jgi:hypothetical protein
MSYETPTTLEAILEYHHISMRIEFDGANKEEHVFSACLPGMRVSGAEKGRSPFIIARGATPAIAVAALANALKGKELRSDDESKRADFPEDLNAASLVKKLEPVTEVEKLAISYVTDVATRMVVAFSLTREAYDSLWRATMGASLLQSEEKGRLVVPISIENENPLLAMKDIAWQLGGKLLLRRDMEFHAPALPNVRHTLQEEIRAKRKNQE